MLLAIAGAAALALGHGYGAYLAGVVLAGGVRNSPWPTRWG
jgi:hypothetical protein